MPRPDKDPGHAFWPDSLFLKKQVSHAFVRARVFASQTREAYTILRPALSHKKFCLAVLLAFAPVGTSLKLFWSCLSSATRCWGAFWHVGFFAVIQWRASTWHVGFFGTSRRQASRLLVALRANLCGRADVPATTAFVFMSRCFRTCVGLLVRHWTWRGLIGWCPSMHCSASSCPCCPGGQCGLAHSPSHTPIRFLIPQGERCPPVMGALFQPSSRQQVAAFTRPSHQWPVMTLEGMCCGRCTSCKQRPVSLALMK